MRERTAEQILKVLRLFRANFARGCSVSHAYQRAVNETSKSYSVTYQTIGDACRRRLGLARIDDFYDLLERWTHGDSKPLMDRLLKYSDAQLRNRIREFFLAKEVPSIETSEAKLESRHETVSFRLGRDAAKRLLVLAGLEGITPEEWLCRNVSGFVNSQFLQHVKPLVQENTDAEDWAQRDETKASSQTRVHCWKSNYTSIRVGKGEAKEMRDRYVEALQHKGIILSHVSGIVYRLKTGDTVLIPAATERRPNRWFLGVPFSTFRARRIASLVFLCKGGEQALDFVLPASEVERLLPSLSKSNGQVKFNVVRVEPGRYELQLPHREPVDISRYLQDAAPLA